MATYVVGDVQGCFLTLQALMEQIELDYEEDRVWFAGDLVNRGPRSLEVLRWAFEHQETVDSVLGNHDLHLLRRRMGHPITGRADTLDPILEAPDADDLLEWLQRRPFMIVEPPWVVVHAGILPGWSLDKAERRARELSLALLGDTPESVLTPKPVRDKRLRKSMEVFTMLRTCHADGTPSLSYKGPPGKAPGDLRPWYDFTTRDELGGCVLFGHWAALGYMRKPHAVCLDTGCVWGGELTALRLEDGQVFSHACVDF